MLRSAIRFRRPVGSEGRQADRVRLSPGERAEHHVDVEALAERALADHLEAAALVEADVVGRVGVEGAGVAGGVADREVVVEEAAAEALAVQVGIGGDRVEVPVLGRRLQRGDQLVAGPHRVGDVAEGGVVGLAAAARQLLDAGRDPHRRRGAGADRPALAVGDEALEQVAAEAGVDPLLAIAGVGHRPVAPGLVPGERPREDPGGPVDVRRPRAGAAPQRPRPRPRISFMISSVPPPIGPRRASRRARSTSYSRM